MTVLTDTASTTPPEASNPPSINRQSGAQAAGSVREEPALEERDAIIYVGGLMSGPGFTHNDVARRLATSFDNSASTAAAAFRAAEEKTASEANGTRKAIPLIRQDGQQARVIADVYEFDYQHLLVDSFEKMGPLRQLLAVGSTLLFNALRLPLAFFNKRQNRTQKIQSLYGAALLGIIFLYLMLLIATVAGSAWEMTQPRGANADFESVATQSMLARPRPKWLHGLEYLKTGIVTLSFLGLTMRFNFKEALSKVTPMLCGASNYLSAGVHRDHVIGELARLIDYLDEQTKVRYRNVHLVAYSFGSVVALDALFPKDQAMPKRFERVRALVTIGCPIDFVSMYWPRYFQDRHATASRPERWINVYSPADVLGSNFKNTEGSEYGIEVAGQGARRPQGDDNFAYGPSAHTLMEWIQLYGFRAHSMYWNLKSENAVSCFEPVVTRLYDKDSAIA